MQCIAQKNRLVVIIICAMIFTISLSGCILKYRFTWQVYYEAIYEKPINFSLIIPIFQKENVWYKIEEENITMSIRYGKDVNNEKIETTAGAIVNGEVKYYHVSIGLWNESQYPEVENKNELKSREYLLERSMDYITKLIYDCTGMWPISKRFEYCMHGD